MTAIVILAAAALAQAAVPAASVSADSDRIDVAYEQLSNNQNQAAIEKIIASEAYAAADPAALINLGSAYARIGRIADARQAFQAAIASNTRYDLQLADGSWMDARWAARAALAGLERRTRLSSR